MWALRRRWSVVALDRARGYISGKSLVTMLQLLLTQYQSLQLQGKRRNFNFN